MGIKEVFAKIKNFNDKTASVPAGQWVNGKYIPNAHQVKETKDGKKLSFNVAGASFRMDAITSLLEVDPKFIEKPSVIAQSKYATKKIYRYKNYKSECELVPEPKNPHDKNAIAIFVKGKMIGYVPKDDNLLVKKIMALNPEYDAKVRITGGDYKIVDIDEDVEKFKRDLSVYVDILY